MIWQTFWKLASATLACQSARSACQQMQRFSVTTVPCQPERPVTNHFDKSYQFSSVVQEDQSVLYCTVLSCTVRCYTVCCTVLYCTVLYCFVLCCIVLCCGVLYCAALYYAVLYCTVLYCTMLYCTVQHSAVQYSTVQQVHVPNNVHIGPTLVWHK
jgi:hypothetical protein